MFRSGKWAAAGLVVAVASVWAGSAPAAQEPKPVDLSALRDALDTAAKRGANVDDIRKALDAFAKVQPAVKPGRVPPELQAVRDAVEAAARKGENVDAVAKELAAVETAVAGRPLARPKPEPRLDPQPGQRVEVPPNPFNLNPRVPFPLLPPADFGGGIDAAAFQKATDLYMKALELLVNNPNDPDALKLLAESREQMLKAIGNGGGAANLADLLNGGAMFPNGGRVPERARLGVRMEKLNAITAEQLGLNPNVGIAVAGVVPGSAAEKAGLKANDIILEFAGKPVGDNPDDFVRQVNAVKAGEKIDLVVMRKGKKVDVKGVALPDTGLRPAPPPRPNLQPLTLPDLLPALPKPVIDAPDVPVRISAAEPKTATPDLEDLRDAVAAAGKRGANVGVIRDALAAFEKAQAKGVSAKPGEAPPELTALRTAVEDALRKGENVDAVAKQLAVIEKAITGREYERPKPPEPPAPEPVPPLPRRGFGGGGFGGRGIAINGAGASTVSITNVNGNYTINARQGDVSYTITGNQDGTAAPKVIIKDGDKTTETDDLKKVPEAYLPTVERLLKMVTRR